MATVDLALAEYAVKVARALTTIEREDPEPRDWYVARVIFGFDGEDDTSIVVVPDEHGDYAIETVGA